MKGRALVAPVVRGGLGALQLASGLAHPAVPADAKVSVDRDNRRRQSILAHHTAAEDAGRVASEVGVGTLVLSHLIPPDDPGVTDQDWIDAAKKHFDGQIILSRPLLPLR